MLKFQPIAPIIITESPYVRVQAWEDFHIHTAMTRRGALCCGDFTCCWLGHRRDDGSMMRCDKDVTCKILQRMFDDKMSYNIELKQPIGIMSLCWWQAHMFAKRMDEEWGGGPLLKAADIEQKIKMLRENVWRHLQAPPMNENEQACFVWSGLLGSPETLKALLSRGFNVDECTDKLGRTVLHTLAFAGNAEAVKVVLEATADKKAFVNRPQPTGLSALHRAAQQGHLELLNLLLANGADPNIKHKDGKQPLHDAVFYGRQACAEALISARADIHGKGARGRTPLHLATDSVTPFGSQHEKMQVVVMLLRSGVRPDEPDDDGLSAMNLASHEQNEKFLQLCRARGF